MQKCPTDDFKFEKNGFRIFKLLFYIMKVLMWLTQMDGEMCHGGTRSWRTREGYSKIIMEQSQVNQILDPIQNRSNGVQLGN